MVKEIYDHQNDEEMFKISNINTTKLQKLMKMYNIAISIEDVKFNNISVIGHRPKKFLWSDQLLRGVALHIVYKLHERKFYWVQLFNKS